MRLIVDFCATDKFEEINYRLKSTIRRAIGAVIDYESFELDAQVSVTLCDNAYIKNVNRDFRGKDRHTDVLSFPMYDFYSGDEPEAFPGESVALGDIVISLERCKEQAREVGNPFLRELAFLTVHSMLHLFGYDHERGAGDEEAQCLAQKDIMAQLDSLDLFSEDK